MNQINAEYVRENYDALLTELSKKDYKNHRWFKNEAAFQQYKQTKETIADIYKVNTYQNVLEIGCGPGTWTEFLSEKSGNLIAVDISKGMLKQARNNIKSTNVTFLLGDFLEDSILSKYEFDAIFSIRAFEYFSNKEQAIKKANSLLKTGGIICIITKNPKYLPKFVIDFLIKRNLIKSSSNWLPERFKNLVRTYSDELHSDWIEADQLKKIMERERFKEVQIYPAVIGLSYSGIIWKIFTLIHSKILNRPINPILLPLVESYLIKGIKSE